MDFLLVGLQCASWFEFEFLVFVCVVSLKHSLCGVGILFCRLCGLFGCVYFGYVCSVGFGFPVLFCCELLVLLVWCFALRVLWVTYG